MSKNCENTSNTFVLLFSDIIDLIKREPSEEEPFRPDLDLLMDSDIGCEEYVFHCMTDCWAENPDVRPDFAVIRSRLKRMKDGK